MSFLEQIRNKNAGNTASDSPATPKPNPLAKPNPLKKNPLLKKKDESANAGSVEKKNT